MKNRRIKFLYDYNEKSTESDQILERGYKKKTLHSSMVVDVDPVSLGDKIVKDMKKKREVLGI